MEIKRKLAETKRTLKLKFKRAVRRASKLKSPNKGDGKDGENQEGINSSFGSPNSDTSLALDSRDAEDFFMINGGSEFD